MLGLLPSLLAKPAGAQESASPADFLPATTAVYVAVADPAALIDSVENHPVIQEIQAMPEYKDLIASPDFAPALIGLAFFENQIGESWREALATNTGGGLYLAVDAGTGGAAVIGKSNDEAKLRRLLGTALALSSMGPDGQQGDKPYEVKEYRGAKAASFDDFVVARYETWFVVTNKGEFAKLLVDNIIDGTDDSLASQDWFGEAVEHSASAENADAVAFINLETARVLGESEDIFRGRTDNPAIELMFGGILDTLKHAPYAVASLELEDDLGLSLSTPFESDWANEHRRFFYGSDLNGSAPAPLMPENAVASITSYRDIADWWLSKEDLYDENVIAQLAQADTQLSTIFSGMDFGQEVLGALQPGVQIVVAENTFSEDYSPDVKLPAFAMVGKLKDPGAIQPRLKIAFQSAIGVTNLQLGMQGQPQLAMDTEQVGSAKISSASYFVDGEDAEGLLLFNFSPSIAFQGEYFILSSTRDLAVELAWLAVNDPGSLEEAGRSINTSMQIDGGTLEQILIDNRESLIANNMIEEGNTRAAAEEQIDALLVFAAFLKETKLDYIVDESRMDLDVTVRFGD
ncbi:MAG: hypothetical protein AAF456_14905 [Planctomycetota bacterium]